MIEMSNFLKKIDNLYSEEKFKDSSELRLYLRKEQESSDEKFNFILNIVEDFTQLRFFSEEKFQENSFCAHNKRNELPLDWNSISDKLTISNDEPPCRIITTIAQQYFHILMLLCDNIHKVLRREREKVKLSSVQQIDSYCLCWLTKQPGRSPVEKAGNKQQLLALVRKESVNTLENRVLKDFLKKCQVVGDAYIREYHSKYSNSERIKATTKLVSFCKTQLLSQIFREIPPLANLPTPNYVLQHNVSYSKMWRLYMMLIQQAKIVELVWPYRFKIFQDYFFLMLSHKLRMDNWIPFFDNKLWFSFLPKEGSFLSAPYFFNVYKHEHEKIFMEVNIKNVSKTLREVSIRKIMTDGAILSEHSFVPLLIQNINILDGINNSAKKIIAHMEESKPEKNFNGFAINNKDDFEPIISDIFAKC